MLRLFTLPLLATLLAAVAGKTDNGATVYLIRHGEKPADGGQGLSPAGEQRAQCLRSVFGASSSYNIGYIIAEQPEDGKSCFASEGLVLRSIPSSRSLCKTADMSADPPSPRRRPRPTLPDR